VEAFAGGVAHGVAQTLESEAHRINHRNSSSHQAVAQLDAQQILLRLRRTVTNGIKQGWVETADARQHLRITPIALAFVLVDRPKLARVCDQHPASLLLKISTDPRTVTPSFNHRQRARVSLA
jgi:hypothetical protein